MEEGGEFGEAEGKTFGGGGAEGDVAQFAARGEGTFRRGGVRVRDGEKFGRFGQVANQIERGDLLDTRGVGV